MSSVKIEHGRALRYCRRGIKKFLERHGFNWKKFLTEGIPEEDILATNDSMAIKAVEVMRKQDGC